MQESQVEEQACNLAHDVKRATDRVLACGLREQTAHEI